MEGEIYIIGAGTSVGATTIAVQLSLFLAKHNNETVHLEIGLTPGERAWFMEDRRFAKTKKEGIYRLKGSKLYISRLCVNYINNKDTFKDKKPGVYIRDLGGVTESRIEELIRQGVLDKCIIVGSLLPWKKMGLIEIADTLVKRGVIDKVIWVISGGDKEVKSFERKYRVNCIKEQMLQSGEITVINHNFLYLLSKHFNNISHKQ